MKYLLSFGAKHLTRYGLAALFVTLALAGTWWSGRSLPLLPHAAGDAQSYLQFSDVRPHGYPLFLQLYRAIWPDLTWLPLVQSSMLWGAVACLGYAVVFRSQSLLAGLATFILAASMRSLDQANIMADSIYASLLALAAAGFLNFTRTNRLAWLAATAICIGAAAATRTAGIVPAAVFACCLVLHARARRWAQFARQAMVAAIMIVGCLGTAAASNYYRNGEFRIGSWAGVSLLGKGLLVARPTPPGDPLSQFNWISSHSGLAYASVDEITDPHLRMLVQRQYYEYLRWQFLWPELLERGVPFHNVEGKAQNRFAERLARGYISHNPSAYVELAAYDYLALWLVPRVFTQAERQALLSELSTTEIAYLPQYLAEQGGESEYYQIVPSASSRIKVALVRATSIGFLLLSLAVLAVIAFRCRLRPGLGHNADLIFLLATVHLVYLSTAVAEAGLDRYVSATWPILCAGLSLSAHWLVTFRDASHPAGTGAVPPFEKGASSDGI